VVFFTSAGWIVVAALIAFSRVVTVGLTALESVGKRIERNHPRMVKICRIGFVILFAVLIVLLLVLKLIPYQEFRNFWTVENLVIDAAIVGLVVLFILFCRRALVPCDVRASQAILLDDPTV
jgi:hypothetical protein